MNSERLRKPRMLIPGDTIALVSPAAPLAALVPHRVQRAEQALSEMGFRVKLSRGALTQDPASKRNARARAQDINELFADPQIAAIMFFIGGLHVNQILPYIDFDLIRKNPKPVIGYSDSTVLQLALYTSAHLVTFYGPAALTQFGEYPAPLPYTLTHFKKALCESAPLGQIKASEMWTEEVLNWFEKADLKRPRETRRNPGYRWLRPGVAKGRLLGGCLPSILHLRGTGYWPDFRGSVLFWEVPEGASFDEGESPEVVDMHLADLELSGVFDQISGMVVGRPFHYGEEQNEELDRIILAYTEGRNIPVLLNVDTGHTDPLVTLPIGVLAEIDSNAGSFSILESGVTRL